MNGKISKKTFEDMDRDSKLSVLFDYATSTYNMIEKRKKVDKALALSGGFMGGFIAIAAKYLIW